MKIVNYEDRYAQEVADMWNASDEGWPGGLTRGIPMTADKVKDTERKIKCYGTFIIMEESKAIGFVRVNPYFDEKEAAYISWLNVVPTYHGKSYGRRLLCRSVECTLEHGLERLDLHTWPGNTKALPAYKKTGFFWVPKTTVYMQNYIPMIMQFPPAKSYFERHDWYRTFQRQIELEEDDVRVEGMNVFPYKWKDGPDELTVWIDRESRGITGFENRDLKVFAKLDRHDVLAGMRWMMTWLVINKSGHRVTCSLKAKTPRDVGLQTREKRFVVPAGKSKEVSSGLFVSLNARERPWDEKSDSVLSLMKIDNWSFRLTTGLRTKQAIEIRTDPEFISIVPGTSRKVYVNLKSNMKRKVRGQLNLQPEGVDLDRKEAPFTISSKGTAGIPLTITAKSSETKCYSIKAWTVFERNRTKQKTLRVRSVGVHGAIADVEEDRLVMENAQVRLVVQRKGAWTDVYDKSSRKPIMRSFNTRLGPPFWPSELSRLEFKMRARNEKGLATGTLTTMSEERQGLRISLQILMSGSNLVQIVPILEKEGSGAVKCQVQFAGYRESYEGRITIPSKHGMIQEETMEDDFPDWMEDVPKKDYFKESWVHFGDEETGLGLIWDHESSSEVQVGGWGPNFTLDAPEVRPGERKALPSFCLIPATTDWRMIRKLWLQLTHGRMELDERVGPGRVLRFETHPKPLALENGREFDLKVSNLRNKKVDGRIALDFPAQLRADRTRFEVKGLCLDNPFIERIPVTARRADLGVYFAKARLVTPLYDDLFELPIVVIGKPGKVSVRERRGRVRADNGFMSFVVAPSFAGSLVSLKRGNIEHVLSAYPAPSQLSWFRPWHGGIIPHARKGAFPGKLHEETFQHEKVRRGVWSGVRVQAKVRKDEKLRGLVVSTEYLIRPKSNVLAILQEFRNAGRSSLYFDGGCMGFFQFGGSRRTSAYFRRGRWRQRKHAKVSLYTVTDNRTVVISGPRKSGSICFVSPSRRCDVALLDMASEGKHVHSESSMALKPKEARSVIHYVVLAATPTEAKKYQVLSEYLDENFRG